ncbi:YbaK/EbsC family protein [Glaciihabitans sp. INWT7]|uniref:aminoacyl-tRNA deacylase n=1 Tax=Glaciihabitans sp. INWT7 TaxID=2596912 RepID=UPI00162AAA85|nr:YbaK/EbsC family protein [Glaciihabitans sp. INWT7]QNE47024.1 YbaK/EbsC family protein [Glaciihabitans sp. INWT7]
MTAPTGRARVLADAAARGLDIEVVERSAADSLEQAAVLLDIEARQIVKSLVVRRHTPEGAPREYLFALIPGDRQISWAKLRAVVGVNKLSLPSPELALEATGFERGTITPLGSSTAWPVFADVSMVGGRIAMGAGEAGYSAFVDADDLIAAYGATVADITA